MARVEIAIRFLYEDTVYADTLGFVPRHEALKIPQLKVEENQNKTVVSHKLQIPGKEPSSKSNKGKKQSDMEQEILDENEDIEMQMQDVENEIQNEGEADQMDQQEPEQQIEEIQNEQIPYQEEDQQEDDIDDQNQDDDLSQISRSMSPNVTYGRFKTKRQKGQLDNFLELPHKKPRKDAKKFDEATQLIRKQQKQRKRRQYIKKLNQAQQKATFDKILNQTGRKFRQREEKQLKEENQKDRRNFKTLGDVPKIITKQTAKGRIIYTNKTQLFPAHMNYEPNIRMSENCCVCHKNIGKYKTKENQKFCSIPCFKKLQQKHVNLRRI